MLEYIKEFISDGSPIIRATIAGTLTFRSLTYCNNKFGHIFIDKFPDASSLPDILNLLVVILTVIVVILIFFFHRRTPIFLSSPGILLYFDIDDDPLSLTQKNTIEKRVLKLLSNFDHFDFKVKFLTKHQVKNKPISKKLLYKTIKRSRASLFFAATINCGKVSSQSCIDVESDYILKHKSLSRQSRKKLQNDISQNLIKLTRITEDNNLNEVQTYSEATTISILTALGLAYIITFDLDKAKLYLEYSQDIVDKNLTLRSKFSNNLEKIIIPVYYTIMNEFESEFLAKRNSNKDLFRQKLNEHKILLDILRNRYGLKKDVMYRLVSSNFIINRDPNHVRAHINIDKPFKKLSLIERFDKAFIYIYEGKFMEAYLTYKRLLDINTLVRTDLNYVYNYIDYILWDEPERIGYYIPLILITYFHRDKIVGIQMLEEFENKTIEYHSTDFDEIILKLKSQLGLQSELRESNKVK